MLSTARAFSMRYPVRNSDRPTASRYAASWWMVSCGSLSIRLRQSDSQRKPPPPQLTLLGARTPDSTLAQEFEGLLVGDGGSVYAIQVHHSAPLKSSASATQSADQPAASRMETRRTAFALQHQYVGADHGDDEDQEGGPHPPCANGWKVHAVLSRRLIVIRPAKLVLISSQTAAR